MGKVNQSVFFGFMRVSPCCAVVPNDFNLSITLFGDKATSWCARLLKCGQRKYNTIHQFSRAFWLFSYITESFPSGELQLHFYVCYHSIIDCLSIEERHFETKIRKIYITLVLYCFSYFSSCLRGKMNQFE